MEIKMTAQELINHFEGTETDVTEIRTNSAVLDELGWDFFQDYEDYKNGKYSHDYSEDQLESYESFLKATDIRLLVYENGAVMYAYEPADREVVLGGYNESGDNKLSIQDISENIEKFSRV